MGLTWSTYAGQSVSDLREAIGQTTPALTATAGSGGEHAGHGGSDAGGASAGDGVGLDAVLKAARAEGLSNPVEVV
ncbi:PepSY domain-containing protein, partial [Streptomyces rubiginosohelvolus]